MISGISIDRDFPRVVTNLEEPSGDFHSEKENIDFERIALPFRRPKLGREIILPSQGVIQHSPLIRPPQFALGSMVSSAGGGSSAVAFGRP